MRITRRPKLLGLILISFLIGMVVGTVSIARRVAGPGPPWASRRPVGRSRHAILTRADDGTRAVAGARLASWLAPCPLPISYVSPGPPASSPGLPIIRAARSRPSIAPARLRC